MKFNAPETTRFQRSTHTPRLSLAIADTHGRCVPAPLMPLHIGRYHSIIQIAKTSPPLCLNIPEINLNSH